MNFSDEIRYRSIVLWADDLLSIEKVLREAEVASVLIKLGEREFSTIPEFLDATRGKIVHDLKLLTSDPKINLVFSKSYARLYVFGDLAALGTALRLDSILRSKRASDGNYRVDVPTHKGLI